MLKPPANHSALCIFSLILGIFAPWTGRGRIAAAVEPVMIRAQGHDSGGPNLLDLNRGDSRNGDYTLAVYYAIPSDVTFDQEVFDRLTDASLQVQAWYQVATGGATWELAFPEVVRVYEAKETRQFYQDNGNWWGSLLPEMGSEGFAIWSPGTVTVIWAHGAGWWAGGAQGCGIHCGVALLGVELFPEFNNYRADPNPSRRRDRREFASQWHNSSGRLRCGGYGERSKVHE